jgi:hypothetical protein
LGRLSNGWLLGVFGGQKDKHPICQIKEPGAPLPNLKKQLWGNPCPQPFRFRKNDVSFQKRINNSPDKIPRRRLYDFCANRVARL